MKLHHLSPILWTKDLSKTILFYETVLGFKKQYLMRDFSILDNNDLNFLLAEDISYKKKP